MNGEIMLVGANPSHSHHRFAQLESVPAVCAMGTEAIGCIGMNLKAHLGIMATPNKIL